MKNLIPVVISLFLFSSVAYTRQTDSLPTGDKKADKYEALLDHIRKETIGGSLDFSKALEKEKGGFFLYQGTAYNKKDFAFLLWGMKVKELGVRKQKEAVLLYESILKRSLTDPEKRALIKGFNRKSENR